MKKLLIVVAPQGSGNHVFAKVLSIDAKVGGWKKLLESRWIGHHEEPFAEYWIDQTDLTRDLFDGFDYWVISVSIPFVWEGELVYPRISDFCEKCKSLGIDPHVLAIVRDQNIVRSQQARVRGKVTIDKAHIIISQLLRDGVIRYCLSFEALYMYKNEYLRYVSSLLDFPIASDSERVHNILLTDSNEKYIRDASPHELDLLVQDTYKKSKAKLKSTD